MKAVINENETPKQKSKYPWIGIYKDLSFIMMFTEKEKGVVLQSSCGDWNIGDYSGDIIEKDFTPFAGSITLSND